MAGGNKIPVGIIAASGVMPLDLARTLENDGRAVFIVALKSMADADYADFDHVVIPVGAFGKIIEALKAKGCKDILLAGKFTRPRITDAIPDALASKVMARLLTVGDNAALEMLADIVAEHGMKIMDKTEILKERRAGEGLLAGDEIPGDVMESVEFGASVLAATGAHDVGQSVLVQGSRVIAIEAAEGTDAMLARASGLIDRDLDAPPVLVKLSKTGQSAHLDPPVIGADTVRAAAEAGVRVIAVESGGVLIADMDDTFSLAQECAVSIIGIGR